MRDSETYIVRHLEMKSGSHFLRDICDDRFRSLIKQKFVFDESHDVISRFRRQSVISNAKAIISSTPSLLHDCEWFLQFGHFAVENVMTDDESGFPGGCEM